MLLSFSTANWNGNLPARGDAGQVSGELVVIDHCLCLANLGGGLRAHLDVLVEREYVEAGFQFLAVGRRRRQRQ
jgi:hypothetical protein